MRQSHVFCTVGPGVSSHMPHRTPSRPPLLNSSFLPRTSTSHRHRTPEQSARRAARIHNVELSGWGEQKAQTATATTPVDKSCSTSSAGRCRSPSAKIFATHGNPEIRGPTRSRLHRRATFGLARAEESRATLPAGRVCGSSSYKRLPLPSGGS